jgi:hypothetical protein
MKKHSFTLPVSFWSSQISCLWSKRLLPVLVILSLILSLISVRKFYNYRELHNQVKILEANLINFDQVVRDKHNLISEQSRLAQKLGYYKAPKNNQSDYELLNYLFDVANLIPVNLVLTKLEVISGDHIIVEGFGDSPDQIISFWRKLLSLDYIIDGKLEKLVQNQFVLQLKIKRT